MNKSFLLKKKKKKKGSLQTRAKAVRVFKFSAALTNFITIFTAYCIDEGICYSPRKKIKHLQIS